MQHTVMCQHIKMADDTRQPPSQPREDLSREALNQDPENKPFTGEQWKDGKAQTYKPPPMPSANVMEGGTQHTAGGQVPDVTLWNAYHAGRPITQVHKQPCARDSFMVGLGTGFATGSLRAMFGGMFCLDNQDEAENGN
jgi:cytochrome c oxidase assembly protein subunit 20